MTLGHLKQALAEFNDDEIVVAGVPFWEVCLTTDIAVKRCENKRWMFIDNSGHGGGIAGLQSERVETVVFQTDRGGSDAE